MKYLAFSLLLAVAGCAGEYRAGDLGQCYADLNVSFCKLPTKHGEFAIVTGSTVLGALGSTVGTAISAHSLATTIAK